MTDRDIVERFAAIMGFGTITAEERPGTHKTLYRWSASNARAVRNLIWWFWPYFGERRRATAAELWERTRACPGASRVATSCRRGHPYNERDTNTISTTGYRDCRICRRERERARYARRKHAAMNGKEN